MDQWQKWNCNRSHRSWLGKSSRWRHNRQQRNIELGYKRGRRGHWGSLQQTGIDDWRRKSSRYCYRLVIKFCLFHENPESRILLHKIAYLDSTRVGVVSDVVKTMTWTLGLPTLSSSYGETGEIREWRDLSPQQQNYLIQIRPPGDVITGVIRELITRQNITNAAILYDKTFGNFYLSKTQKCIECIKCKRL